MVSLLILASQAGPARAEGTLNGGGALHYRVGPTELIAPGENRTMIRIAEPGGTSWIWVYWPARAPKPGVKWPLVLMAPAGSPLIYGMDQGELNRPQHLAFARAGFVVVAYSIDGDCADMSDPAKLAAAARAFWGADAGMTNFDCALKVALAAVPDIDTSRIYAVGHSSAGTLALQVAEHEPRIAACVGFAPVASYRDWGHKSMLQVVEERNPGFKRFYFGMDPLANAARLRCPLLLFHADDDLNVSLGDNARFVAVLQRTNHHVNFVRVPTGGHYPSMMSTGIPLAIHWLESRPETQCASGP